MVYLDKLSGYNAHEHVHGDLHVVVHVWVRAPLKLAESGKFRQKYVFSLNWARTEPELVA
jgi:hypothetical protein